MARKRYRFQIEATVTVPEESKIGAIKKGLKQGWNLTPGNELLLVDNEWLDVKYTDIDLRVREL